MGEKSMVVRAVTPVERDFWRSLIDDVGVGPGDRLVIDLLPGGEAEIHAAAKRPIDDFVGFLSTHTRMKFTIDEIKEMSAAGWAGLLEDNG